MEAAYENNTSNCTTGFITNATTENQDVLQTPNNLHKMDMDRLECDEEEDLGPETDVDAVDEAATIHGSIPIDHLNIDFNKRTAGDLIGDAAIDLLQDINQHAAATKEDILKTDNFDLTNMNHNLNNHLHQHIDDNKLLDSVAEGFEFNNYDNTYEPISQKEKELDFSEKREYSFEREEYEKEVPIDNSDIGADVPSLLIGSPIERVISPLEHRPLSTDMKIETKPDAETYIVPEPEYDSVVDHLAAAENVVIPESGEDSEDEWNYIKIEKKIEHPEPEIEHSEPETKHLEPEIEHPEPVTEETEASIAEEKVEVDNEQQEIDEISESQLAAELLHQEQTDDPELTKIERQNGFTENEQTDFSGQLDFNTIIETEGKEAREEVVEEGAEVDDDDDDMSSLNPDAKEFVPTSPVRGTPIQSPQKLLLINEDDKILTQSPHKYKPMGKIIVPSEEEFDQEISKRPSNLHDEIVSDEQPQALNQETLQRQPPRPGSSSSQCSYQEMNLKEAMHGDEKQEYAAENDGGMISASGNIIDLDLSDDIGLLPNGDHSDLHESLTKSALAHDPMNMSFYNDGSIDSRNPFEPTVDLNALHQLPDTDDSDKEGDKDNKLTNGQLNGAEEVLSDLTSPQNKEVDEISEPKEDQYENKDRISPEQYQQSDKPESELLTASDEGIGADDEADLKMDVAAIKADKMNDLSSAASDLSLQFEAEHFVESIKGEDGDADKYIESALSPMANEFHPFNCPNGAPNEEQELPESDNGRQSDPVPLQYDPSEEANLLDNHSTEVEDLIPVAVAPSIVESSLPHSESEIQTTPATEVVNTPVAETIPPIEPDPIHVQEQYIENVDELLEPELVQDKPLHEDALDRSSDDLVEQLIEVTKALEIDAPKPVETEVAYTKQSDKVPENVDNAVIVPEVQQDDSEKVEKPIPSAPAVEITDDVVEESVAESEKPKEIAPESVTIAATAVTTAAAVAAAAAVASAKSLSEKIAVKTKKSDPKSKAAPIAAAPAKKSASATTAAAASLAAKPKPAALTKTSPSLAATKTAAAPLAASKPKSTTSTSVSAASRKPLSSTGTAATSATTKKPLPNGDVKSSTTTSLTTKRVSESAKSTVSSSTAAKASTNSLKSTSRPALISSTTTSKSTTVTTATVSAKPHTIVGRPGTLAKAPASKATTTTSTTSTAAKPKASPSTVSTARTTTARQVSSPTKPIPIADKSIKDAKPASGTRTTTTTTTTAAKTLSSPRTTTTTVKKTDVVKSPVGAKTISKSSTTTSTSTVGAKKATTNGPTSTVSNGTTAASAAFKKTNLSTRVSLAPQTKKPLSPTKKTATKTTTTTTSKSGTAEKQSTVTTTTTTTTTSTGNGTEEITKTIESLMIDNGNDGISELIENGVVVNGDGPHLASSPTPPAQPLNAIIDLSAD